MICWKRHIRGLCDKAFRIKLAHKREKNRKKLPVFLKVIVFSLSAEAADFMRGIGDDKLGLSGADYLCYRSTF